jgi:cold shock CspA family protein/ribosome-associated translation inhibitor RaiA
MQAPLEIAYRNVEPSAPIERRVARGLQSLERVSGRITSCRVMVEVPHPRHQKGNLHRVRIELRLPGVELVVKRDPPEHHEFEDVTLALGEAFDMMKRRLLEELDRIQGLVKAHEEAPAGTVVRLFPGYGFLETTDGREVYFHENAVVRGGFASLDIGTAVRYAETAGEKGPQASTVIPVG